MRNKNKRDFFFTKKNIARLCYKETIKTLSNIIDVNEYIFIEPSAGYGAFVDEIKDDDKEFVAFDLMPRSPDIEKENFLLRENIKKLIDKNKKYIVIGNPPFGKKGNFAIDFFHEASYYSSFICFIFPNIFRKWNIQKKIDWDYKLIHEILLPSHSFYLLNKKDYNCNCVFQIWTNKKTKYGNKRILKKPKIWHKDFLIHQYNGTKKSINVFDKEFDFAVFCQGWGDYKTIITNKDNFDYKKHYMLFKGKDEKVVSNLKGIDFEKLSKNNTIIPGFRKSDIVEEYERIYE